jgi:hypothetical protein
MAPQALFLAGGHALATSSRDLKCARHTYHLLTRAKRLKNPLLKPIVERTGKNCGTYASSIGAKSFYTALGTPLVNIA